MPRDLNHIIISGYSSSESYTSPLNGRERVSPFRRDRNIHGTYLKDELQEAINSFKQEIDSEYVYLEFTSEIDCLLAFDSFEDNRRGDHRFVSSKLERISIDGEAHKRYRACVYLNTRGISKFLRKIEEYLNPDKNTKNGNPRNQKLLNNIANIERATLKSFWQESEIDFPDFNNEVWWEIWLRRDNISEDVNEDSDLVFHLLASGVQVSNRRIVFPEHIVRLVRTTGEVLSTTVLYSDRLAEIRKPKETADFFLSLDKDDSNEWIEDFKERTVNHTSENSILITILDTGVNREHPLLADYLSDSSMDSVNPEWGTADSIRDGHGTQMAGISLYGDLSEILGDTSQINIYHRLESVKLININNPHHPDLYGAVTSEAVSRAIILNPENQRVLLMAVTATDGRDKGKPSSWSSSVDQICYGENGTSNDKFLFCISGGNVGILTVKDYPVKNFEEGIHDPGQAFNALTVGTYTNKYNIDQSLFQGAICLANPGGMSPSNSTSISWDKVWAIKPEIVLEGGNLGELNNGVIDPESLRLMSTNSNFQTEMLSSFGDTSAASGLAARYAAILKTQYSNLWTETIKGLLVHSAFWTDEMRGNKPIEDLTSQEKGNLLRSVGYGVPNLETALRSANNSLTLISQNSIKPFMLDGNLVKTNEMHLYELPWPSDVLMDLFDNPVKLTVTLIYFIEPNPGNKQYSNSYYYQSHGLRFKMIDAGESLDHFKERVNKEARSEVNQGQSYSGENWILGSKLRDKGSIHKDIWKGTGADLATRKYISIYPVNGWWKSRKKLMRYDNSVRYSLIISIDSPDNEVDLYTPVLNQIDISI